MASLVYWSRYHFSQVFDVQAIAALRAKRGDHVALDDRSNTGWIFVGAVDLFDVPIYCHRCIAVRDRRAAPVACRIGLFHVRLLGCHLNGTYSG